MGEAVQHGLAPCQTAHRPAVVLLIKEKAGLLPVLYIHQIFDAIFGNFHDGGLRRLLTGQGEPALVLRQTLLVPQGHVVPLEHAPDGLAVLPENIHQCGQ